MSEPIERLELPTGMYHVPGLVDIAGFDAIVRAVALNLAIRGKTFEQWTPEVFGASLVAIAREWCNAEAAKPVTSISEVIDRLPETTK